MARFSLFRRKRQKAAPLVTASPILVDVLRSFDGGPTSYGNVYRRLAPVRTVVDFIADNVATTSLKVYERARTGRPEARDHPLAVTLRRPNPDLTTRGLISGTVRDLAVYGNAYWRKFQRGQLRWLIPLPPFRVIPYGGDLMGPARYELWQPSGTPTKLNRDEVVHFKFYNPEDPRVGVSKLDALKSVLQEEIEASKHRAGFFRHAARRDGLIERPLEAGVWTDDALARFQASWKNRHAGTEGAGTTPVLEEGMKWVSDTFDFKSAEFSEGRKFILEATARVYNVPLSLLGLTQTATFASQKEFHKSLFQEVLPPWYELIQSEIELQLLSWFEDPEESDVYVEFNVESKLRGDFTEQLEWLTKSIGRPWMTVLEGRDLMNLEDRGDPTDSLLAVPITNFALGAGAAMTEPPPDVNPKAFARFLDRQESSVLGKTGAGRFAFDEARWTRELSEIVPEPMAREWTRLTKELLEQARDLEGQRQVFAALKAKTELPALAQGATQ